MEERKVFVMPCDLRHGRHYHCGEGLRRFFARNGIDYGDLMAGKVTAGELMATDQALAAEVAHNAEERVRKERENGRKEQ